MVLAISGSLIRINKFFVEPELYFLFLNSLYSFLMSKYSAPVNVSN